MNASGNYAGASGAKGTNRAHQSKIAGALLASALLVQGCGGGSSAQYESYGARAPKHHHNESPSRTAPAAPEAQADYRGDARTSSAYDVEGESSRVANEARPGLGTQWGETRTSRITSAPFSRDNPQSPFATASVYYDDEDGARAMANQLGVHRFDRVGVSIGGGIATMRLKDGSGRFLTGFTSSRKNIVVGEDGDRYSIVIQSNVPARIEVVVSVDGLDVIDGREASFTKRGYLLDPHGSIEIEGFRQSTEAVAAFRFGAVTESYAQEKHGESRNVGVIGVALFNEVGTRPSSWLIDSDVGNRLNADPFPGRFATPP